MNLARMIARALRAYAALKPGARKGAHNHRRVMRRRKWSGRAIFLRLSRTGTDRRLPREPSLALSDVVQLVAVNPACLRDVAEYAHRHYPDACLARLGADPLDRRR